MVNFLKLAKILPIALMLITADPVLLSGSYHSNQMTVTGKDTVRISFRNTVNHLPLALIDSTYVNPFGEEYNVTKFKYYISNVKLSGRAGTVTEKNSYHLIDQNNAATLSFDLAVNPGAFQSISFTIGVDSLKNVSGTQSGALDPANDMFWTWQSGYIMAKLEGTSPASNAINHRIEQHVGGYKGEYNTIKKVTLPLLAGIKTMQSKNGKIPEIIIEADLDKWWNAINPVKISEDPVCGTPGEVAKKIADNYSKMFFIKEVINP